MWCGFPPSVSIMYMLYHGSHADCQSPPQLSPQGVTSVLATGRHARRTRAGRVGARAADWQLEQLKRSYSQERRSRETRREEPRRGDQERSSEMSTFSSLGVQKMFILLSAGRESFWGLPERLIRHGSFWTLRQGRHKYWVKLWRLSSSFNGFLWLKLC